MEIEEKLPIHLHHETVRAKLKKFVEEEKITEDQADDIYISWLQRRRNKISVQKKQ